MPHVVYRIQGLMEIADDELNFTPEVAREWADEIPRRRRPRNAAVAGPFFLILILGGLLTMGLIAQFQKNPEIQNQTTGHPATQPQVHTQVHEARNIALPLPIPQPQPEPDDMRSPDAVFRSQSAYVPALPDEIEGINLDLRTKTEGGTSTFIGKLPPGLDLASLNEAAQIREAPDGDVTDLAPKGTQFVYRIQVYAQPCWRWIVSFDGKYEGYACFYTARDHESGRRIQPEGEFLPDGWDVGALGFGTPLRDSPGGRVLASLPRGTVILYKYAPETGWRKVVAADGSFWGYACLRPTVPYQRRPMRPEYEKGAEIVRSLEIGSSAQ